MRGLRQAASREESPHLQGPASSPLVWLAPLRAAHPRADPSSSQVAACLQSGLPVILLISLDARTGAGVVRVGHAVVATGYADDSPSLRGEVKPVNPAQSSLQLTTAKLSTIFVHDDNLGPHAHYELRDAKAIPRGAKHPRLVLHRGHPKRQVPWWTPTTGTWTPRSSQSRAK